mgnify:CR=1 FL=1
MEAYIEIYLKNIVDNYKKIVDYSKKNVIAVIKDNAYGHSLIQVGQILASKNVFMLAVSNISEAILLRKNMIFSPLLLLGRCDDAKTIYSLKITQGVSSLDQLKNLAKQNIPISIHLELETGMHRLGLNQEEIPEAINIINNSKLKLKGIYTHFCSQDNIKQKDIFKNMIDTYFYQYKLIIHSQASNFINEDLSYCNTIRVGLALYGYNPYLDLKPALKLICPIIRIQKINKDVDIGYDYIEKTSENGYILTLPFGYSHGLSRLKTLCFFYKNNIYYQIGKQCMDMTMFFSKDEISSSEEVEFISLNNTNNLITLNNENIYYILSSLSPNIKRIYKY